MRRSIWIVLGIASILAAASLLIQAPDIFATRPPEQQTDFILGTGGFVGILGVIAIACFFPRSHPITLRIIGVLGIISCMFSIYSTFRNFDRNWAMLLSRLAINLIFWLPASIYLAITGRLSGR
ncbi:hypothetical protein IQ267_27690 [filamentous cyanobacterium LEGE 07170]|nr:hypothetical protein [filamentous cyanobacterium LEGE 07170]